LGGANVNATTHTGATVSVTGNITGGNILGGANVNATTHTGTTVSVTGNINGANLVATTGVFDIIGNVRTVVQNSNAAATYTLVASDAGKHINYTGTTAVAVPISVFAAGDVVTIFNNQAANILIVQNTSVTLRLAGTASTGNRTLTQYGLSSVLCITGGATPTFVISGAGLI